MDRSATYDFLFVFRSKYGPISYRFRDKGQRLQKNSHPLYLTPPLRGFPLEFCNGSAAGKTTMMFLRESQKSVTIYVHSFGHSIGIGRTDRQTENTIALCMRRRADTQ